MVAGQVVVNSLTVNPSVHVHYNGTTKCGVSSSTDVDSNLAVASGPSYWKSANETANSSSPPKSDPSCANMRSFNTGGCQLSLSI